MSTSKPRLLGLSGSLRKDSWNTAILSSLSGKIAGEAQLEVFALNPVPLYDQDLDTPERLPASVKALRAAIAEVDGLIIASPEYNYGVSGVLKNALDWASRPHGQSTLTGKPVLTLTSSPSPLGGARAQAQLTEVLIAIGAQIVLRPQTVIGSVYEKVVGGELVDPATIDFLRAGVSDLLANIARNASVIRQEA